MTEVKEVAGGRWQGAGSSCESHGEGGRRDVVVLREEVMDVVVRREGGARLNRGAEEAVDQSLRYLMEEENTF